MRILFHTQVGHQLVYVTGDIVSYDRLAEVVRRVAAKEVERLLWDKNSLRKDLSRSRQDAMRKYGIALAAGNGVAWELSETYNAQKGIPVVGVEQWLHSKLEKGLWLIS